ncbi:MAG: hypothetical protein A2W18_04270 [Candidatus Muproteobacteria bacterium RBG_16_60_9]|uniref:Histidine kinase n=1 Tax=Candidatus Muproteobacteria bacterium RBG_16_60_9 TaxID=1817755 RepID=A0A1F6UVX7_9PROT|nr:MAG: hypothetical protein A2W18_04270 [Candidatus Muproteobacteria bacterium RBG_16_60_9]
MKTFGKALVAGSLLLACGVATADVSYNAGVTTDYRFRGVSQNAQDPALQGGADFSDKSGVYLGIWGSTIDFGSAADADLEVDLYGGVKWKGGGVDWDAGLIHYAYPGSESSFKLPFTELYIGGAYGPVTVKYYYTDDYTGTTTKAASYLVASGGVDLGSGVTLNLSVGRSSGGGIKDTFVKNYTDYKVGVSKGFGGFNFDLSYIDTSGISPDVTTDVGNTEGTVVLTVLKSF